MKPVEGETSKTVTLTATIKCMAGRTKKIQRVIKVGGSEQDVSFEINPVDPKPKQAVQVTVRCKRTARYADHLHGEGDRQLPPARDCSGKGRWHDQIHGARRRR